MYDAIVLNSDGLVDEGKESTGEVWMWMTAAAVALLLIVSGLFVFNTHWGGTDRYNTILVPPGQRINLILSDNSNIWLNANSTFKYPAQFKGKKRTVYLDGEGFFDVESDVKSPFVVETSYGCVEATGTLFNVEAYKKHDLFEASLFEGRLQVASRDGESVVLQPNEGARLADNGLLLVGSVVDPDRFLWRNGLIVFNDVKLEHILNSLEKYFDVTMQIDSERLPEHTYTGKFRQTDGVEYALRVLQRSIKFSYRRDVDSGIIHIN